MTRKTTLEVFPDWCKKHGISLEKCTDEQFVQFFLYFNARIVERQKAK